MKKQRLILHRGYKGKYPENSLISFERAIEEGISFETDIRLSKDDTVFLIHDETLDRLFNGNGKIKDYNSSELKNLKYNEDVNQKLCSLEELCELVKKNNYKNLIFIHIKELEDLKKVIEVLERYNVKENIRFFACDDITLDLIRVIKQRYSKYKVGLHFNDDSKIKEEEFNAADFIWADEIKKKNITKELVDFSHMLKKPIYAISPELITESVFNENIEKRWKELLELNVDAICTDMPEEFLNFSI